MCMILHFLCFIFSLFFSPDCHFFHPDCHFFQPRLSPLFHHECHRSASTRVAAISQPSFSVSLSPLFFTACFIVLPGAPSARKIFCTGPPANFFTGSPATVRRVTGELFHRVTGDFYTGSPANHDFSGNIGFRGSPRFSGNLGFPKKSIFPRKS